MSPGLAAFFSLGEDTLWPSVIDSLRGQLSARRIDEVERATRPVERTATSLRVAARSETLRTWMNDGRLSLLDAAVTRLSGAETELALLPVASDPLEDPVLTLDAFIPSPSSQRVVRLARELGSGARAPEHCTLVMYAPGAAGKTHLLRGIAREHSKLSSSSALSMGAHHLSLALVAALRRGDIESFRTPLESCDLLLVDDLQALADRSATQAELARAIARRRERGAPTVLATSAAPSSVAFGDDLRSGLQNAHAVEIEPPGWETRVAVILERIARWQVPTGTEVASFLAGELGPGLARIDAVLTRLMTHPACATGLRDPELVRRILDSDGPVVASARPQVVLRLISRHFGIRPIDLRSPNRSPRVATPRQIAMYLLRHHCGLSYPAIGQQFNRHHTTAMHACRRIESQRDVNSSLRATVLLLEKELLTQSTTGG